MLSNIRQKSLSTGSFKGSFAGIALVANTFVWFLYSCRLLSKTVDVSQLSNVQSSLIWNITIIGAVLASVFGFYISNNPKIKSSFIQYWLLAGILLSLMPAIADITLFPTMTIFFALVGVYFGLGMPVSLAFFASVTKEANRSKLGGVTFLTIFASVILLAGLGITDPALVGVVLAMVKIVGLMIILKAKPYENFVVKKEDKVTYKQVIKNRTFVMYFVPWIMFSVANYIARPIVSQISLNLGPDIFNDSMMVENIVAGIVAVISGFLADRIGRRRLVLAGFVLLGLGYASLGLLQDNMGGWWFYTMVDGIAWGIFYTMFLMTIWGDISLGKNSEKFYAIGYLPFLFSIFTEISIGKLVPSLIAPTAIFSFISLFLFVAVLPLAYAPETLPHQVMKNRELQQYIEKAQRAVRDSN